jgi:hypothetical protein
MWPFESNTATQHDQSNPISWFSCHQKQKPYDIDWQTTTLLWCHSHLGRHQCQAMMHNRSAMQALAPLCTMYKDKGRKDVIDVLKKL